MRYHGKKQTYFLLILFSILLVTGHVASPAHFGQVTATPAMVDFVGYITINGQHAAIGNEAAVFDEQGLLVGNVKITTLGQYGVLHAYGDDASTTEHDGASTDSILTFKIWHMCSKTEIVITEDMMSTQAIGSYAQSPIPPRWTGDKSNYIINIATFIPPQPRIVCPGLNVLSIPLSFAGNYFTASSVLSFLINQNIQVKKIQIYQTELQQWKTFGESCGEDFSFTHGLACLIYVNKNECSMINFQNGILTSPDNLIVNLFPGLNLIDIKSLSKVFNIEDSCPTWPNKFLEQLSQEVNLEAKCIMKFNPKLGRWQSKHRFFEQTSGSDFEIKEEEGYLLYLE